MTQTVWVPKELLMRLGPKKQRAIPCVLMRGGTSRGPVFLASDLPTDPLERNELLLDVLGSGHELQVDGIGGGNHLTSKVAIVGPSKEPGADVDYLFVQVHTDKRQIDAAPNCGNMLAAVAPFAIEKYLVRATAPTTTMRIFNVNTGKIVEAEVQTPGGFVTYAGDTAIDGVPGTAAPIKLTFLEAAGSKTGQLFPTGNVVDQLLGHSVTCIDMAMPLVLIDAREMGKRGDETPAELNGDLAFMSKLKLIRHAAGAAMGMGNVTNSVVPKPILLGAPRGKGTLSVRYFLPFECHYAMAITGAVGLATACTQEGTIAHQLIRAQGGTAQANELVFEHPSGVLPVNLEPHPSGRSELMRTSIIRTARRLFAGEVYVP